MVSNISVSLFTADITRKTSNRIVGANWPMVFPTFQNIVPPQSVHALPTLLITFLYRVEKKKEEKTGPRRTKKSRKKTQARRTPPCKKRREKQRQYSFVFVISLTSPPTPETAGGRSATGRRCGDRRRSSGSSGGWRRPRFGRRSLRNSSCQAPKHAHGS